MIPFMSDLFILQNQDRLFLGKQKDWLDGRDLGALFKTPHKDEAINQLVEVSAKDYTQRVKLLVCAPNEKGLPSIDEADLPAPLPKAPKVARAVADTNIAPTDDAAVTDDIEADDSVSLEDDELVYNTDGDPETDPQAPLL